MLAMITYKYCISGGMWLSQHTGNADTLVLYISRIVDLLACWQCCALATVRQHIGGNRQRNACCILRCSVSGATGAHAGALFVGRLTSHGYKSLTADNLIEVS